MDIINTKNPSEKHFSLAGQDAAIEDSYDHTPVTSVNQYHFMDDAYYSSGGFRDGTYLIPHTREMFYANRRELSAYRNFMRPILRSLVEPCFEEPPIRLIDGTPSDQSNHVYVDFLENVDNDETTMDEFAEETMMVARRHGVSFVIMDNYSSTDQPATMAEASALRIMPYIYRRSAEDVDQWKVDQYGRITSLTFVEEPEMVNGKPEARFRMWTDFYSQIMGKDKEGNLVALPNHPPIFHNLGVLPIVVTYASKPRRKSDILVDPPLYDIARLCHVLYNKDSEIRDQERAQAFSNFYMQGEPSGNVTVGPHNVIFVPMDATIAPGFASPDSSILAGLMGNADKLRESIFEQAEQQGVVGVKSATSGIAAEWHFWAVESQLKKTSHMATSFEDCVAELFMKYTMTDFEFSVEYPDDFQPGDQTKVIDRYKTILDLKPVDGLSKALWRKIARMVLADEDPEELEAIEAEIDEEPEPTPPPEKPPIPPNMMTNESVNQEVVTD